MHVPPGSSPAERVLACVLSRSCSAVFGGMVLVLLAACGRDAAPGPTPGAPPFDEDRAFTYLETQVGFGPRVPGTAGHSSQLSWMLARLDSLAPDLLADTFSHVTTAGDSLTLVNVMARFAPENRRRVVVLAHWDTRPRADQAADSALHDQPIPGANDGASGTAVLLELAEVMAQTPPPFGVDLLFVDGEDFGPDTPDMFLGARRYAATLPTADESLAGAEPARPIYGVLLDMVGDADPSFPIEGHSAQYASLVVDRVWRAADRLGYQGVFTRSTEQPIYDDHIPLLEAGLQTANVIDFTYGPGNAYWHTLDDDVQHVSAATLGIVGRVMVELIYSGG